MTQDEADRAEAEARKAVIARVGSREGVYRPRLDAYVEAVRRTERLKAEAVVADWRQRWERTKRAYLHLQGISDADADADIAAAFAAYQEGAR